MSYDPRTWGKEDAWEVYKTITPLGFAFRTYEVAPREDVWRVAKATTPIGLAVETYDAFAGPAEEVGKDTVDTIIGRIPIPTPRQALIAFGALSGALIVGYACKTFGEEIGKAEAEKIEKENVE